MRGHPGAIIAEHPSTHVSSHAPVRGHRCYYSKTSEYPCFKSCPREGASEGALARLERVISFKSCPREGASFRVLQLKMSITRFKSCPREGASGDFMAWIEYNPVSSHAPVRGHLIVEGKL